MKRLFIFPLFWVIFSIAIIAPDNALGYDPYGVVDDAVELLDSEITRDEEILSAPMNITRLKMTRKKLSRDMPKKEEILKRMKETYPKKMASIIEFFEKTIATEKRIANNTRIGDPHRVRTRRLIKSFLPKKRESLKELRRMQEIR